MVVAPSFPSLKQHVIFTGIHDPPTNQGVQRERTKARQVSHVALITIQRTFVRCLVRS